MQYSYVMMSTFDQNMELQAEVLRWWECTPIFESENTVNGLFVYTMLSVDMELEWNVRKRTAWTVWSESDELDKVVSTK